MFKYVVLVCLMVAVCAGAPQQNPQDAETLQFDSNVGAEGYDFNFKTSNGISRHESGKLDNPGSEDAALSVNGDYSYVAPDGTTYNVDFIADRNGFQPQTSHTKK